MKCQLKIVQYNTLKGLKTDISIIKVLEYQHVPAQQELIEIKSNENKDQS